MKAFKAPNKGVSKGRAHDFPRDRWGRPQVSSPSLVGGDLIPYARPSSLGKVLSDDSSLIAWGQRQVVWGLVNNRTLLTRANGIDNQEEGRETLGQIVKAALEVAGAHSAADYGTGVHACLEEILRDYGLLDTFDEVTLTNLRVNNTLHQYHDLDTVEAAFKAIDLLWEARLRPLSTETPCVNDQVEAAGTFDLQLQHMDTGKVYIGDLKTSKTTSLRYSGLSWGVQLATYATSQPYDIETQQRLRWEHGTPDSNIAYVIHVPSDDITKASLVEVDIEAGFRAAQLALRAKRARKHKFLRTL